MIRSLFLRRVAAPFCVALAALHGGWCFAMPRDLSAPPAVEQEETSDLMAELVEVFDCDFVESDGKAWDVNFDNWPDRWTRLHDDDHPHYSSMAIEDRDDGGVGRALVIRPDGASARASSPPIRVMPKFSYIMTLELKCEQIEHGSVFIRAELRNAEGEVLQVEYKRVTPTGEWEKITLGAFQPRDPEIDRMVVHFDFDEGPRSDLQAKVSIADIRMSRQPSIRIHTDSEYNVYTDPSDVVVTCSLSGILERNPEIRFQLLDATNKRIGKAGVLELDGKVIEEEKTRASEIVDGFGGSGIGYEGKRDWRPPITDYGFYRVRVQMISSETQEPLDEKSVTVAVVPELESSERGEFGWSLPEGDDPLSFTVLQQLLPLAGVNLVKVPVWYPAEDEARGAEIIRFAELLAARGIDTVGVLEDPTDRIHDPLWNGAPSPIEGLLVRDHSEWVDLIDHVITKLSLRIRWWQLGRDGDTSFVGYNGLIEKILTIRRKMFRFGQDIRLGLGWRWDHMREWPERISWDFEQMAGRESTNAAELGRELAAAPPSSAKRWVLVEPPATAKDASTEIERHESRVRDFVEQIITAKVHGADGIFVADPFSGRADPGEERFGVMNEDGTPGELLLPWRTCARLLGGAKYIGSNVLPNGSKNWIFKRPDNQIVMVLWRQEPSSEVLYLGHRVQHIDIWGKHQAPDEDDGRQVIPVGRMPSFVLGINEGIARWRMSTQFESTNVPSIFGVTHPNALMVKNEFGQGVGGEIALVIPQGIIQNEQLGDPTRSSWRLTPNQGRISLAAGEELVFPFDTTLADADYGPQRVRIDFTVVADREYSFSVWRELHVGLGDLMLEVWSHLTADGRLLVKQRMINTSGTPADFKCLLYAPPSRRKRAQVFQLGPETDKKTYTYLKGDSIIGRDMLLKIEEVDGRRVMIHRFKAEDGPRIEDEEEEDEKEKPLLF